MKLITHVPSFMLNAKQGCANTHASKQRRKTCLRNPCVDFHRRLACPSQHAREPPKKAKNNAYRVMAAHELKVPDHEKRVAYCRWLQAFLNEHPGILDCVWFTDEAWFLRQTSSNGAFSKVMCMEIGREHCRTSETTSRDSSDHTGDSPSHLS
jgi:hypothetical protein